MFQVPTSKTRTENENQKNKIRQNTKLGYLEVLADELEWQVDFSAGVLPTCHSVLVVNHALDVVIFRRRCSCCMPWRLHAGSTVTIVHISTMPLCISIIISPHHCFIVISSSIVVHIITIVVISSSSSSLGDAGSTNNTSTIRLVRCTNKTLERSLRDTALSFTRPIPILLQNLSKICVTSFHPIWHKHMTQIVSSQAVPIALMKYVVSSTSWINCCG